MPELLLDTKEKLLELDMSEVPMDDYWNLGEDVEHRIHRIHAYPAKFPAFIPTKAINYAIERNKHIHTISDIFCGCGTVALEAKIAGIDFWGCDINPVATMIAATKSSIYDKRILNVYYRRICEIYEQVHQQFINREIGNDNVTERLLHWFYPEQYHDLNALLYSINCIEDIKYRRAFQCVFSSILKSTSKWLTKSIKPQIDPDKKPSDVFAAFQKSFGLFEKVVLTEDMHPSKVDIVTGNYLTINNTPQVDMIITSPPYVTSYEYADLHQLSALWLGFADDYRDLRKGTIGSMTPDDGSYLSSVVLNTTGNSIINAMTNNSNIQKSKVNAVKRYFLDMQDTAKKSYNMLSQNGYALIVLGDTEYKTIKILNSKHMAEAMFDAGFKRISLCKRQISRKNLTPYRDNKGKFSNNCDDRKVYHEEYVIVGRK